MITQFESLKIKNIQIEAFTIQEHGFRVLEASHSRLGSKNIEFEGFNILASSVRLAGC